MKNIFIVLFAFCIGLIFQFLSLESALGANLSISSNQNTRTLEKRAKALEKQRIKELKAANSSKTAKKLQKEEELSNKKKLKEIRKQQKNDLKLQKKELKNEQIKAKKEASNQKKIDKYNVKLQKLNAKKEEQMKKEALSSKNTEFTSNETALIDDRKKNADEDINPAENIKTDLQTEYAKMPEIPPVSDIKQAQNPHSVEIEHDKTADEEFINKTALKQDENLLSKPPAEIEHDKITAEKSTIVKQAENRAVEAVEPAKDSPEETIPVLSTGEFYDIAAKKAGIETNTDIKKENIQNEKIDVQKEDIPAVVENSKDTGGNTQQYVRHSKKTPDYKDIEKNKTSVNDFLQFTNKQNEKFSIFYYKSTSKLDEYAKKIKAKEIQIEDIKKSGLNTSDAIKNLKRQNDELDILYKERDTYYNSCLEEFNSLLTKKQAMKWEILQQMGYRFFPEQ